MAYLKGVGWVVTGGAALSWYRWSGAERILERNFFSLLISLGWGLAPPSAALALTPTRPNTPLRSKAWVC